MLRWLTLFLFFEGLATVPKVYFESELRIGRAVVPELTRNLFMAVVSVGLAFAGFGVWSLLIGHVGSAALYALMLWWRAWGKIPLVWQRGETWNLARQSLPLASIWFLTILVRHIDPLILGWRFEGEVVANYGFAYENAFRASEIIFRRWCARSIRRWSRFATRRRDYSTPTLWRPSSCRRSKCR